MVGNIRDKISFFLKRGYLLNPDILKIVELDVFDKLNGQFDSEDKPLVLTKDVKKLVEQNIKYKEG